MIVIGIDIETTGLDNTKDDILEVALVHWDTVEKLPIHCESFFIKESAPSITPEAFAINHIDKSMIDAFGTDSFSCMARIAELAKTNIFVAHNGNLFDRPFIQQYMLRQALANFHADMKESQWIDTSVDVDYPANIQTRKLIHLAAEHGFVNPFPHRALFDVLTMLKVLACYDFKTVLALSQEPSITVQAVCRPPWDDAGVSTGEAKLHGYRWDGAKKTWQRQIKKSQLERETAKAKLYTVKVLYNV